MGEVLAAEVGLGTAVGAAAKGAPAALGAMTTSLFGIKESLVLSGTLTEEDIPTADGGALGTVEAVEAVADFEAGAGEDVGAWAWTGATTEDGA